MVGTLLRYKNAPKIRANGAESHGGHFDCDVTPKVMRGQFNRRVKNNVKRTELLNDTMPKIQNTYQTVAC